MKKKKLKRVKKKAETTVEIKIELKYGAGKMGKRRTENIG